MSAQFTDIPAEQWEKDFFADELKEDRKIDKGSRVKASGYAAAFDAFCEVAGFIPEARLPLHIFLSQTKGKAPDEEVFICETDAGRLLPGDDGVAVGSLRKRWVRAWNEIITPEMARTGKCLGKRIKGSVVLATRHAKEKKQAPVYFSELAQAIVDIERAASGMRGLKRDQRFKRAALVVWANLPSYIAPKAVPKIKAAPEPRGSRLAGNNTRRMKRCLKAAREIMEAAKLDGTDAQQKVAAHLAIELGRLVADTLDIEAENAFMLLAGVLETAAENEPVRSNSEDSLVNTEWTENEGTSVTKSDSTLSESDLQNAEEKRTPGGAYVDGPVHFDPDPTPGYCVACGDKIHPERLEFDTELCDLCGPPRQKGRPTAFRMLDEMEKRKGKGDVIYAEEFTV
jgi:hypothetical protein